MVTEDGGDGSWGDDGGGDDDCGGVQFQKR